MRRTITVGACLAALLATWSSLALRATAPRVPSNTWAATGAMAQGRAGAAATLLHDGRVLVSGGVLDSGVTAAAERYSPTSERFLAIPSMHEARANHNSTLLPDGTVLVAGGTGADGRSISGAELYDPQTNSWRAVAPLNRARAGHTATVTPEGYVVIAGGSDGGVPMDSVEIYDPYWSIFTEIDAKLAAARTDHAAVLLYDGRVLVTGGFDGTNVLSTVDIIDPYMHSVAAGPPLGTPRAGHTATVLLNGEVLVVGGASGTAELASAEIFDSLPNSFRPAGSSLAFARQRHQAILLPHNHAVLIVGGTAAGAVVSAAELFVPWQGTEDQFFQTNAPATPRLLTTLSALSFPADVTVRTGPNDGLALLAGGSGSANGAAPYTAAELYGFATVNTDKADYAPGSTVRITGGGWEPGETVTLVIVEEAGPHRFGPFTAIADSNGDIFTDEFRTDDHDFQVAFFLTAYGSVSQAQTAFTDAQNATSTTFSCAPHPISAVELDVGTTCTATVTDIGSPVNGPPTGTVAWTKGGGGAFATITGTPCTLTASGANTSSCSVTFMPTDPTSGNLRATYTSDNTANWAGSTSGAVTYNVVARSGSGTMIVSPTSVTAGTSGHGFTFTFQSASDNTGGYVAGAQATIDIPAGWTAPQTGVSTNPGYVSITGGTCTTRTINGITGTGPWTITVDIVCTEGRTFILSYAGGGTAVTAPTTSGPNTFLTRTKNANGTLTNLGTSPVVTVNPGSATKLGFTTQPGGGTAGAAWGTQPVVAIQDTYGNTVSSASASVALAIGTNPGGGTLTCTTNPRSTTSGVATFSGCQIDKAGTGYTLTATATGLTSATSSTFDIAPGTATRVAFTTQPGGGTGGVAWGTQPVVTVQDALGNTVTGSTAAITLTIGTNPGSGTLTCTTNPLAASSGVATFAGCRIDRSGNGYTVVATATGLTSATSSAFNITVGPATQLAFTTHPGGGTGGIAWGTQPVVTVQDAGGNTVTSSTASITLAIDTNPSTGALTCTSNPLSASSGGATFAGCRIDKAGTGYTLTAASAGLTGATSNSFNITVGPAAQVVFTTEPGGGTGGIAWGTQPVVTVQDAGGNTVTSSSASVTVAIGTNPGGGTLSGTATLNAVNGVATFSGLSIDRAGTGYTLTAASSGLTGAISASFNITVGPAAKLAFTTSPGNGTAGAAIPTQPVVAVQDAGGNTVTSSSASVTVTIGTNPGGGTLSGTATIDAVNGLATFSGLSIDKSGTGYTLTAASAGLTGATSSPFNITFAAAAQVVFTTQPASSTGGVAFPTQPVVTVQDAFGNTVTNSTASVTVAIGTNPSAGTLSGTATVNAVNGVATFSGLSIDSAGSGYTLTAASAGLTGATSNSFNITVGPAAKVTFTTQPADSTGGIAFPTQPVVTVQDAGGNTVTSSSASVTLAIGSNPSSGTLSGTATVDAVNGVATFSGLSIDKAGTGYTLAASSAGLAGATSSTFDITVGAAVKVAFTTQPGSSTGGIALPTQPVVTVQDAGGNTVTSSTASIALAIGTNPSAGTLSGTATLDSVNGVATFSGLSIDRAGSGYTLTAASAGLTGATSNSFNITVGPAASVVFTTGPADATGGVAFPTQPVVTVQDAGGNTVTSSSASITLAIGTNPSAGTLSGTATLNAVNGVATFSGLSIDRAGTGYTLTAASAGLTGATSTSFNITVGPAAKLAFTTSPGNGTAGAAFPTQPVVTVQDAGGNTVTSSTASVTVAIGNNPGGGTLSGTATMDAVNGVATFSGLSIDKSGTGYTLTAASAGLTGTTSSPFNITFAAAAQVVFTTGPASSTGGVAFPTQPVVTVQDAFGNTVTDSTASVTVAIGTNPSAGTLSGTATVNAVNGVATFSGLSIDKAGTGYTLTAASAGLSGGTSNGFNITVGPAVRVVFTTQPGDSTGGIAFPTQPVVTVQDAGGNTVTSSSASVTVAIGTNPASGTLSGTATVSAVNGVATFGGLSIDRAGTGYTLTAASAGLTGAISASFDITVGPAVRVVFTTSPGNGTAGAAFPIQPVVTVQDAGGNTVPSSSASVTVAIGTNPGGGTLSGTATINAANGVATFSGLSIDKSGTGYTLTAASAGLTGATSTSFNITFAAAAQVAFSTQPGGGTGGIAWATQPVVRVQDAFGNTVTNSTASVTVAIGTNPSAGTLSGSATVNAVNGVATFSGLSIDKAGTGYTLTAASAGLTDAPSNSFNITVGPAVRVVFTTGPASSTGGIAFPTQPVVTVQDAGSNTVTSSTASVTVAIGTNPASGALSGTATINAVNGVATFGGLAIDKAGTGYTLTAASAGLTGATSSPFNITVGSADHVVFTTQPGGGTGGLAWASQPVVTVRDAGGNTVTSSAAPVTLAIGSNPGSGSLSGTATVNAVNGVATFSGLSIDKAGTGYTLTAASAGLTDATSSPFNITVGPAAKVAFTTGPASSTGGVAFPTQPVVTVQDAGGNTVTSSSASVTVAIGTNPSAGTLSGTVTINAVNGVATFSGLSIDKAGTGYTLTAASSGLTGATSASFNITVGPAVRVVFTTHPGNGTAGAAFPTQPVVTVQDAGGNTVTSSTASVTVAIGTNPGGGTLSGTATVDAVNGVATFSGLSIDKSGTGYTLTAASAGLTGATSSPFNITFAAAAQVAFTTQPGGGTGGLAWATQPVVTVQDAFGNTVTNSTASVTVAIGTNPSAGTLSGTATVSAVNGVATFSGLSIDRAGTGYTLTGASAGLTGATSNSFNITVGAATRVVFTAQPASSTGGVAFPTQPVVTVQDAGGNTVTSSSASVTVAIGTNPASGTLSGTATVSAVNGVATFSGLSIDKAGTGYTLTATSAGLTGATSASFNITVGPAANVVFTTQPGGGTGGLAWASQPVVTVRDAGGNTVTSSTASITLAIGSNPGSGTLSGTATVNAVNGVATFSGLSIDKAGTGYTLTAASSGLTGASSNSFNITVGPAVRVAFTTQPASSTGGVAFPTQPVVTVQDAGGNTVTSSSASVTVAIGTNPASGTLSGTATVSAVNGVATFSGLSIDRAGTGYTLTASSAGLTGATSAAFNIAVGPATRLVFTTSPGNGTAGAAFPTQPVVTVQDAGGNTVTSSTASVTVAIGTNPGGGTLSGTATVDAVNGVATFSGLSIDKSGTGYTLTAASAGLTGATSTSFNITFAAAAQVAFTTQPGGGTGGLAWATQPVVTVQDAFGNTVTNSTASVSVAIGTNPSAGTLSGTATVNAVNGVATFSGLSIDKAGTGYTLTAASAGLTDAPSNSFNITVGPAVRVVFTTGPASSTGGIAFPTQPVVTVQDAGGNTVTSSSASVTVAIGTNPAIGALSGTATINAVNGVATFGGLSIDKAGTGYTLTAASAGLTGATSSPFNITVGPAAKLAFTTGPSNSTGGVAFPTQPVVTVQDAGGNTITTSTASVTAAIGTNPSAGTLSGTATVNAVNGVATFSGLSIDRAGSGYTLTAASAGLTGATSSPFNITVGPAVRVAFTTHPANSTGGTAFPTQPVVRVQDAGGNTVTTSSASVTLAIGTNPSAGTLSGTATVNAMNGVATFSGLSIDKAGTAYTLTAASAGLTGATSNSFDITVGAAAKVAFTTQPASSTGGVAFPTQPVVTVQDAGGNTIASSTASVTVAIGTNPSAGTLSGTATLNAVNGVATFSGLSINRAGTGYTLTAASTGLTGATSSPFNITVGPAVQLAFTTSPSNATVSTAFATQPVVTVQDAGGNTVPGSTASVTVAIGNNAGSGSLGGTATINAVNGVATYAGLSIDQAGTGYTLAASSAGLSGSTSGSFTINPASATAINPVQTGPVVAGNTSAVTVTVTSISSNGLTPNGSVTVSATNGVAGCGFTPTNWTLAGRTWTGSGSCNLTTAAATTQSSTITAAYSGDTNGYVGSSSPAATLYINPKLVFTTVTGTSTAGTCNAVALQFQNGNGSASTVSAGVTITLTTTSPGGAFYSNNSCGTVVTQTTIAAGSSTTTANTLYYRDTRSGTHTLTASATSPAPAGSTFGGAAVAPTQSVTSTNDSATQIMFAVQPSSTAAGATISPAVVVQIADQFGNPVTSGPGNSARLNISIGNNPGGGTLTGGGIIQATGGVSTFSGLSINNAGTGYTLALTCSSACGGVGGTVTSTAFNIHGTATKVVFVQQPTNALAGAGISPSITVEVQDSGNRRVGSSAASVTLAIGTNPGGGTLSGTTTVNAVNGVATFSGVSINKTGNGYTLNASSSGLTGATSTAFNITPATATTLAFTTQPAGATVGAGFATQPVLRSLDSFGNNSAVGLPASLTLTISIATGTGTLLGTTNLNIGTSGGDGVATFTNLEIDTAQTYTLGASVSGSTLSSATSSAFTVARANTTVTVSNASATFGQADVTLLATVADGNATVNEGTVTFTVRDSSNNTVGFPVTSGTVAAGAASATFSLSGVAADRYTIHATYNPAATVPNFNTSTAPSPGTLTVTTTLMRVISGSYTGNGTAARAIDGLGFVPDVVIAKADASQEAVVWTSTMTGGLAKPMGSATAAATNLIESRFPNGFTIGTDPRVNGNGTEYYWTAFGAAAGGLVVGTYTGNGTSQSIAGVGFQPDLVMVVGENATQPVFRSAAISGSVDFTTGTSVATAVTSLDANGFSVGASAAANASGVQYHYAAWTQNTGKTAVGLYAGSGSARSITGLGFQPQAVIVKSYDCATRGHQHSTALGPAADASLPFNNASGTVASRITSLQANGFGLGTDGGVNGGGCNYAWMAWAGDAPTAVRMVSASATRYEQGTLLQWETGYEIDNLGFHVYREEGGARRRVTPRLIAGSGLLVGSGAAARSSQSYTWWDLRTGDTSGTTYWLEDVDVNGTRTWHGPIERKEGGSTPPTKADSALLRSLLAKRAGPAPGTPRPASGNTEVPVDASLTWTATGATSFDVRLGTVDPPDETIRGLAAASYTPPALAPGTTYYWQVTANYGDASTEGPVWSFTTGDDVVRREPSGAETTSSDGSGESFTSALSFGYPAAGAAVTVSPEPTEVASANEPPARRSRLAVASAKTSPATAPAVASAEASPATAHALASAEASPATAPADGTLASSSESGWESAASGEKAGPTATSSSTLSSASATTEPSAPANLRIGVGGSPPAAPPATPHGVIVSPAYDLLPAELQRLIAGRQAVKLLVDADGWYRVPQAALAAAGLPAQTDAKTLQLVVDGLEQSIKVTGTTNGTFGPGAAIQFYGQAADTPHTDERAYWLIAGRRAGLRLRTVTAPAEGAGTASSFADTVVKNDRLVYFAALLNGDAENFFGSLVTSDAVDEIITAPNVDSAGDALLHVALQGVTDDAVGGAHQVDVRLNGVPVGILSFTGRQRVEQAFSIGAPSLREGDNVVTLTALGGEGDVSLVDVIRLTYPRTFTAHGDRLRFSAAGGQAVSVDGFSGSAIRVLDITEPRAVVELLGAVTSGAGGFRVSFAVPGSGPRTLLAFTDGNVLTPVAVRPNSPSEWGAEFNAADHVIVSHRAFQGAVGPLKAQRTAQGLTVAVVDVEDLYDEFSFGQKDPQAIRRFLIRARSAWRKAPRYVVLVGNATNDPREYLMTGEADYLPTKLVDTAALETASDDWFGDADGDGLAELAAIGRLPARSPEEAAAMVDKIVAYEGAAAGSWSQGVALVADQSGPGDSDFAGSSTQLRAHIPAEYSVTEIFRGQMETGRARSTLLSAIENGHAVVNYTGHGSVEMLQGDLLTSDDARNFSNGARLPVFVMMNCLSGFFHGLYPEESLAESLIRNADGGAVAVWASSGFTSSSNQVPLNSAFVRAMFSGEHRTLGQVIAAAKRQAFDPDVRRTWILFGDPALRVKGVQ